MTREAHNLRLRIRVLVPRNGRISRPVGDSASVLAIFPGNPYIVVTDAGRTGGLLSRWVNPFMAGKPRSVAYFSEAK